MDIRKRLRPTDNSTAGPVLARAIPEVIGQDVLSGILGISKRRIQQLAAQGHLTKAERGHYPWPKAVHEYCTFLRGKEELDTHQLKARQLELQNKVLEQKLHDQRREIVAEVQDREWAQMIDCLAEFRNLMQRIAVDEEQRKLLDETLRQATENAKQRRPTV